MEELTYTITGEPLYHIPTRTSPNGIIYTNQKDARASYLTQLKQQHKGKLIQGPIKLEIIFFMPVLQRLERQKKNLAAAQAYNYHFRHPEINDMYKWFLESATGVILQNNAIISELIARKIYSELPRTEILITRIMKNAR